MAGGPAGTAEFIGNPGREAMPTNLPPDAAKAEERYRAAVTTEEKIETLTLYLGAIPKHKGTDKLRADLRRRLSQLKESAQSKKGARRQDNIFRVPREGAGQVMVVGPANAGKSSLVAALTNARPEISEAPFTTWKPVTGMMSMEDIKIQLVDTPALDRDFVEPEMMDMIRRADLVWLVADILADPVRQIEESAAALRANRIVPRHEKGAAEAGRAAVLPFLVLANKSDDERAEEDFGVLRELVGGDWQMLPVSAATGRNLDRLKRAAFDALAIIRVYSKTPGKKPDLEAPFVLPRGSAVADFAARVHHDFAERLKTARVWGSGAFDGQSVGRDHVLQDRDIVELRI